MALSIKNEETSRAVVKLASLTGQSYTEAIREAVEEKIRRLEAKDDITERALAIGRDCAERLPDRVRLVDPADLLYGTDGLPR